MASVDAFAAALRAMATAVEVAVDDALKAAGQTGYRDIVGTKTFENRTYALRTAFAESGFSENGDGFGRHVFVDPDAQPLRGKTPPAVYARFLEWGTDHGISGRGFAEHARLKIERDLPEQIDRFVGRALR